MTREHMKNNKRSIGEKKKTVYIKNKYDFVFSDKLPHELKENKKEQDNEIILDIIRKPTKGRAANI